MPTDTLGVNPADIQFSLFTTPVSRGPHRAEIWTLADLHNAIRTGHWWDFIAPVRELAPHKYEKDESGKRKSALAQQYSDLKDRTLPYAVFSGTWDPRHRHADGHACKSAKCPGNGLLQPSGLRLLDIDDLHDGEGEWIFAAIDEGTLPWAAAAWTSTGGDGIHIVAWLDPAPTDQATSHAAYAALASDLAINLPGIEIANDTSSKNLMRPAFVSADSTARLREDATPFRWMNQPQPEAPPDMFEPPKAHTKPPTARRDADRQLVLQALDAMAQHSSRQPARREPPVSHHGEHESVWVHVRGVRSVGRRRGMHLQTRAAMATNRQHPTSPTGQAGRSSTWRQNTTVTRNPNLPSLSPTPSLETTLSSCPTGGSRSDSGSPSAS